MLTFIDEVVEFGNASRYFPGSFGKDQRASAFGPSKTPLTMRIGSSCPFCQRSLGSMSLF
jgi:hypothetical protein